MYIAKVWKIIFLWYLSVLAIIYAILWHFLCRVFRNWMLDHDESSLVSSVVFGADMWTTIGHLSYIHNTYISLHVTHIIIITIHVCVYCNFNILLGIYTGICKYCHEVDNQF